MTTLTSAAIRSPNTSITRNWKSTFTSLIIAAICLALSVILLLTIASGPVTIGIALIPAVLFFIFLFSAISGAGEATCPNCSKPIDGLSTKSNDGVLCQSCHRYVEGKDGHLWTTEESRIADNPLFTSPLPETFAFPEGCCVCGKPATHKQTIEYRTQNASSAITAPTVGVTTTTKITVEVPHCDEHKDGAALTSATKGTGIRFRSYPYLRAFCALNNTTPA